MSRAEMEQQYRDLYAQAKEEVDSLLLTPPAGSSEFLPQGFVVPVNLIADFEAGYMTWGELLGRLKMYAAVAQNQSELPADSLVVGSSC